MMLEDDTFYLNLARAASKGAKCTRRQVGAVLVVNGEVAAIGYNTSEDPEKSCIKGFCPRGQHYKSSQKWPNKDGTAYISYCGCGQLWPCPHSATPTISDYNHGKTRCIAVHAEVMATRRYTGYGAHLFCTDVACADCTAYIRKAGVARVVTPLGVTIFEENLPLT